MKAEQPRRLRRGIVYLCAVGLVASACTSGSGEGALGLRRRAGENTPDRDRRSRTQRPSGETIPARSLAPGFLLASSFEYPICGFWQHPKPGCEFGVEGDATAGPFPSRTGDSSVRMQRMSASHMGVIADVPLPRGHGFIGVAARVPAIPKGAIQGAGDHDGHIQLMQLSPTDGALPAVPVEVRLFADRSLGIGLFSDKTHTVMSDWIVPVDEWFYIVVEVSNGTSALQRMWLFDSNDDLVDKVVAPLETRQEWGHQHRSAQKVGGSTSTGVSMYTYYDDWYVATRFMGPIHISPSGEPES